MAKLGSKITFPESGWIKNHKKGFVALVLAAALAFAGVFTAIGIGEKNRKELKGELSGKQEQLDEANQNNDQLQGANDKLQDQNKDLTNQNAQQKDQIDDLQNKNDDLQNQLEQAANKGEFKPTEEQIETIKARYLQGKQGIGAAYDADALTIEGGRIRIWFKTMTPTGMQARVMLEFNAPQAPFDTKDVVATLEQQAAAKDSTEQPTVLSFVQDPTAYMSKNGNRDLVSGLAAAINGSKETDSTEETEADTGMWWSVEKTLNKDGTYTVSMFAAEQNEDGTITLTAVGTQAASTVDESVEGLVSRFAKQKGVEVQQATTPNEEEAE